ncbi:MAG TPA: ABC transporter permease [Pseudonocardiaceae bacterium]|nr:ABC transporter permease [Pseudonocardiaceae bacterium]
MTTATAAPRRLDWRDPAFWSNNAVLFGLIVVVVVFAIMSPAFFTAGNISDLLVSAAILVVLATGQQFAIVVAGIDLSIGSNLPWAAALLGFGVTHGWSLPLSIILAIVGGTAVGVINGLVVTKLRINDFIVTLGTFGVMNGLALLLTDANSVPVNSGFLQGLALNSLGPIRYFWLVALAVAVIAFVVLFKTKFGTHLLATGGNRDAARSMGIKVDRVRIAAYTISGLLVGLAAVLLVARTGTADPSLQTDQLLSSIAAVVLGGSSLFGGRASIVGTVAGALLLTVLINGFTLLNISQYYQPIAVGLVVLMSAVLSRFQR